MRRIAVVLILIMAMVVAWQHQLLFYGFVQAKGQLSIIWKAKPLDYFLENPDYPDSLKSKIQFIQEVKAFAFEELEINPSENYSSLYDQEGKPLMWVVTACQPFALEAKMWKFPIIGSFPYKGFFDFEMAKKEYETVKEQGFDVGVRNPGGWSTLGWFNDPVLSEMLNRNEGQLAELIIHELTHSTIFVKDSVTLNENLASFIGHKGAILFLQKKYNNQPEMLEEYLDEELDYNLFVEHFIRGATLLDTMYKSMQHDLILELKKEAKEDLIKKIVNSVDTLKIRDSTRIRNLFSELPNNTYFMSFLRYQSKQDEFDTDLKDNFENNLKAYIHFYKLKHPF